MSRWSNICAEWDMCTAGNPPLGIGVNWGRVARLVWPFWLSTDLFMSANARWSRITCSSAVGACLTVGLGGALMR